MKKIIKLPFIIALVLIIIACADNSGSKNKIEIESPYLGETLRISEKQVFRRNAYATRISQAHLLYDGTHDITAYEIDAIGEDLYYFAIGEGNIDKGILSLEIDERIKDHLIGWYEMVKGIPTLLFWDHVTIDKPNVKGNFIWNFAFPKEEKYPNGFLFRERITGTSSTITNKTVFYIYVDRDCRITGRSSSGYDLDRKYYYFTEGDLDLPLRKGFNIITASETYGTQFSGSAYISLEVKTLENPENYKWVLF